MYIGFNMNDPVVGGYDEKHRKLRRAMSLAVDREWRIEHFHKGRAIPAEGPLPPGIFGYEADFDNPNTGPDLEQARKLLAEAGYPGGKGADGKQLVINYDLPGAGPDALQSAKAFVDEMVLLGIKVEIQQNTWAELLRKMVEGRTQVFRVGWLLDYPDPENFLQLLYGPNKTPGPNHTEYDRPEYNELFEKMKSMPDTEERAEIIRKMVAMFVEDAPWIPRIHPVSYGLRHCWYKNYKPHGITGGYLKYRDLDTGSRDELRDEWNRPNYLPVVIGLAVVAIVGAVLAGMRTGFTRKETTP
jgi:ABC-type transport system substrate-binding protein